MKPAETRPFAILIAALGGEGGGVLMNWIVAAARASGLPVQATSVPGVAQRTGSTSYYVEMLTTPAPTGQAPIFALAPIPGRIDLAVASELAEAARLMERGFVSPTRTILIASTHRIYATAEKAHMGDGRFDGEKIKEAARLLARRSVALDLDQIAREQGTQVSATLFGAMAASGALPWPRDVCERVIGEGRAAEASRRGFAAAFDAVLVAGESSAKPTQAAQPQREPESQPEPAFQSVVADLPHALRSIAQLGFDRVTDFQDEAYGALYLARMRRLTAAAGELTLDRAHALNEAARRLALWMAYEDVPRVADLKSRPERFERLRREIDLQPGQIFTVTEYLKPGAEEIAALLPPALGRRLLRRVEGGGWVPFVGRGIHLRSTSLFGFALLRSLAGLKRVRRFSLRYAEEQAAIEAWLAAMTAALERAPGFASALVELPRLLKGYGDTQARGKKNYDAIFAAIVRPGPDHWDGPEHVARLRGAISAALADPEGMELRRHLKETRSLAPAA